MPTPTSTELNNMLNAIYEAMKQLQSVQKEVTSNPEIDQHVGTAYSELSQAVAKLNIETTLVP